jgi:hypothetical protein
VGDTYRSGTHPEVRPDASLTNTTCTGGKMASAPRRLAYPRSSFVFDAKAYIIHAAYSGLSTAQLGREFTKILEAIDRKDFAFLRPYRQFVGRIYYRAEIDQREPIPGPVRRAVFTRDGLACVECGSDDRLELDHFIPYSKGGATTVENLRVLCKPCNRRKGARMPEVH